VSKIAAIVWGDTDSVAEVKEGLKGIDATILDSSVTPSGDDKVIVVSDDVLKDCLSSLKVGCDKLILSFVTSGSEGSLARLDDELGDISDEWSAELEKDHVEIDLYNKGDASGALKNAVTALNEVFGTLDTADDGAEEEPDEDGSAEDGYTPETSSQEITKGAEVSFEHDGETVTGKVRKVGVRDGMLTIRIKGGDRVKIAPGDVCLVGAEPTKAKETTTATEKESGTQEGDENGHISVDDDNDTPKEQGDEASAPSNSVEEHVQLARARLKGQKEATGTDAAPDEPVAKAEKPKKDKKVVTSKPSEESSEASDSSALTRSNLVTVLELAAKHFGNFLSDVKSELK